MDDGRVSCAAAGLASGNIQAAICRFKLLTLALPLWPFPVTDVRNIFSELCYIFLVFDQFIADGLFDVGRVIAKLGNTVNLKMVLQKI